MTLCGDVVHEMRRLGATIDEPEFSHISWPEGTFSWSLERAQAEFPELELSDESEMEDYFHPIVGLRFIGDEGFWVNWENDFEETDTVRFAPFARDESFYYFIDRRSSGDNPDIYCVPHDAKADVPYHPKDYTLRLFLIVLERD